MNDDKNICRAFTFINYHIPLPTENYFEIEYSTIGFFDGLYTKNLTFEYIEDDLTELWKYSCDLATKSNGFFSYQNIFGISSDIFNVTTDKYFWEDTDYPLIFTVFLQLSESYRPDEKSVQKQIEEFIDILKKVKPELLFYIYATVDKNDFIVCLRTRKYSDAVFAIKELHKINENVVYSYSVLSIQNKVLNDIENYDYLFKETIDSICFKGTTNSYNRQLNRSNIQLDQKYYSLCSDLVNELYDDASNKDYKIYDILGDDDFRLIARDVKLGKLLEQFGAKGLLNYTSENFRFSLFSSSLVLNSNSPKPNYFNTSIIHTLTSDMDVNLNTKKCDVCLKELRILQTDIDKKNVKQRTIILALFQLLNSLKVLEKAPTKKYDFYSLYEPFLTLVKITSNEINEPSFYNSTSVFDFLHSISITLNSIIRTDIQFFQIRDFNAIIHYAPTKLRAFYALWASQFSKFLAKFSDDNSKNKTYSFILTPGMYEKTAVRSLNANSNDQKLMLITIPERHLYIPKWITIILAHEVSHFVGTKIRCRKQRHDMFIDISARYFTIELGSNIYSDLCGHIENTIFSKKHNETLYKLLNEFYMSLRASLHYINSTEIESQNEYHSFFTSKIMVETYDIFSKKNYEKLLYELFAKLRFNITQDVSNNKNRKETIPILLNIIDNLNTLTKQKLTFIEDFIDSELNKHINVVKNLCSEAFADIIAIKTLGLDLEKYILSFINTEYIGGLNETSANNKCTTIIHVRIAIVIYVMKTTCSDNKNYWDSSNAAATIDVFKNKKYDTCIDILSKASMYLGKANGYKNNKPINWLAEISKYKNYTNNDNINYDINYLLDHGIFTTISNYLIHCVNTYEGEIKNNNLQVAMSEFKNTYNKICLEHDSKLTDIVDVIDQYLYEHSK